MEWHTFQSFSYAECGFPHSGYRSGSLALYLIHEFLFLNFQIHRISTLSFRLSSIDKSDNMLHSPSGFPSRISCRIIGCDFSSLDTFTYCLLKAVFHKYHAAEFIMRWRLLGAHEVRFSLSFTGLASPPSQTARTPFDVYGFPLIIFAVLRMNQFMTFGAYHKSFPSPFAHKEYPLRIAL